MGSMTPTDAGSRAGAESARDPWLLAAGCGSAGGSAAPSERSWRAALDWLLAKGPVGRRARAEIAYWLLAFPLSLLVLLPLLFLLAPGLLLTGSLVGALLGLALLALLTRACRTLGRAHLRLAGSRLDAAVTPPAPFQPGRGILGRLDARLRDAVGWRAVAYVILRLPLACVGLYFTVVPYVVGLFYLSYPFWWLVLPLRGLGKDGRVHPLPVSTPFPVGGVRITTFPETLLICLLGVVLLAAAQWTARLAVIVDSWMMRNLLGATGRAERIRELEASRARAVDDSAATLRRVERDLHDGAQARLVALAMHLGRAKEQLGPEGEPPNVERARDLLSTAHQGAKDALTELRDLARGIHPPALDGGLEDALASLTASSVTPATLSADIGMRPTPAIETIAYFCVAELLTNVTKHSRAAHVMVEATGRDGTLGLSVSDDGDGGARRQPGGGLAGLEQRVSTVDGTLRITSPPGGPTVVTIKLPLQA
jgi:signal transduction histidine kinase